jgi:hypothetical protein
VVDIRHHLAILRRWRGLVIGGVALAVVLAILVSFSVGPGGFEWRSEATFRSESRTFVTQAGFPWGRTTLPGADPTAIDPTQLTAPEGEQRRTFAPPSRFTELATIYSYLVQSDVVRRLIEPEPSESQLSVATVPNPVTGDPLPLLSIHATANSASGAQELNRSAIQALREYLQLNVRQNGVPPDERVKLQVLNPPSRGALISGRSITRSVMAALLVLVGTFLAVYVLENLYPGRRPSRAPADPLADLDFELDREAAWEPVGQVDGPKHPG